MHSAVHPPAHPPGSAQVLSADERAACAVLADNLAASRLAAALGPVLCLAVLATLALHPGRSGWAQVGLGVCLLMLTLAERVLASRVALDAGLFDRLADGRLPDLALLDAGLQQVYDIPDHKRGRPLAPRLKGACRLQRWHFGAVTALLVLAVAAACTP